MKIFLTISIFAVFSLLFYQCSFTKSKNATKKVFSLHNQLIESVAEDGLKEAQEMEFKLTHDISLNYIPKYRMIRAAEALKMARKISFGTDRVSGLSWTERGPYLDNVGAGGNGRGSVGNPTLSGRIRAIWVDLNDAGNKTVWVGSASGGLWKTTDITATPATWVNVSEMFSNLSVSSICQDPQTPGNIYFGTGEKTYNQDAVRGGGVWKSTDNGATFNLLANTTGFYNVSKIVCDAAGYIYLSTVGSNGIQRSTNGGLSWTNITPTGGSTNVIEMNLSSTGTLHIVYGYYGGGISGYRYTVSPATVTPDTWTAAATVFTNANNNTTLASKGDTLYAMPSNSEGETNQIWKSTDGGANWAATNTTPPIDGPTPLSRGQGWFCQGLAVDPSNANNVMAGGLNSYISTNGGNSWSVNSVWVSDVPGSNNYIHADHHNYVWSKGNQILCAGDGGLFYSADGGSTFMDRNQGLRIKQFYSCAIHPTQTNYFLAGAQDNGVHQLNGPGITNSLEIIAGDGGFVHIDEDEPAYQFGAYVYNQYRRSTDEGNSFSFVNFSDTKGQFINPTAYDDMNNNLYGAWAAGSYVRWINAPSTSNYFVNTVAEFMPTGKVTHAHVSNYTANRVYFGIDNGKIVKVDNANSVTPAATDITGSGMPASSVSCISVGTNDDYLLATFSNYGAAHVWVSTTGGGATGWVNISGNLPDIPVRWAMLNPEDNTKATLATEMGIYETDLIKGSATVWVQNSSFPMVRTDMLKYRYSDNTILAATHGRGLWSSAFIPAAPYIRFSSSYIFSPVNTQITEATGSVCRNYKDYTLNMHIDQAPIGTATVALVIAGGATAIRGKDFDFTTNGNFTTPSSALTFATGATIDQPITIRVYDIAQVKNPVSFTFNYNITGGSNAQAAPSSSSYTFNIGDNKVAPVAQSFDGIFAVATDNTQLSRESPFRGNLSRYRIQYLFTPTELSAAGITGAGIITALNLNVSAKKSTIPFNGFTIAMANSTTTDLSYGFTNEPTTTVYTANYTTIAGANLLNFSTPFVWDGTSNIAVNMCFDNGSATSGSDLVSGSSSPLTNSFYATALADGGAGSICTLPATDNSNARIYATFTANDGNPIETVLNNNRTEFIEKKDKYIITNNSRVINTLTNSGANLGCVNSSIFAAGNTWSAFQSGQASQKVIQITPSTNSNTDYTVGLYYTLDELGGKTASGLKIAKTTASTLAAANSTNTVLSATTATAYGTGYVFTANFTGFSKFFLVDNNVVLPVELITFGGYLDNNRFSALQWRTTNQYNLRSFEVERSFDAVKFTKVGVVNAIQQSGTVLDYNFTDAVIAQSNNYYRLRMVDLDGRATTSAVVLINNERFPKFVEILHNPVTDNIAILINNREKENVSALLINSIGQVIKQWEPGKIDGSFSLSFNGRKPAAGIYTLKIAAGDRTANFTISVK